MEEGLKSSTSCNSLMQPDDNDLQHASGQLKFAPTDSINNQLLSFIDLDEIFAGMDVSTKKNCPKNIYYLLNRNTM